MKKLWITGVSLSIFIGFQFLQADLPGQETLTFNRGAGTCFKFEKDAKGFDILNLYTTTNRCGWFTVMQKPNADGGWNGYVKMVNVDDPKNSFYLGSLTNSRSLKFGKNAKVACYICQPDNTNCLPNDADPEKRAQCWTGTNKIVCETQVPCSRVLDVTECYSEGKGVFANQYNDLKLCGERDIGINLSGAGAGAEQGKSEATTQVGQITGAKGGAGNISSQSGLAAPAA
jgi:hypothetical protein